MAKNSAPNKLTATVRTRTGKGASRQARRDGLIPTVLYGHGTDPQHLELNARDFAAVMRHSGTNAILTLDIEGTEALALTKALDIHPVRRNIQHVDLLVVVRGEKVNVDINVSVEGAKVGTQITAGQLELPKGVSLTVDPETLVVNVVAAPTAEDLESDGAGEADDTAAPAEDDAAEGEAEASE